MTKFLSWKASRKNFVITTGPLTLSTPVTRTGPTPAHRSVRAAQGHRVERSRSPVSNQPSRLARPGSRRIGGTAVPTERTDALACTRSNYATGSDVVAAFREERPDASARDGCVSGKGPSADPPASPPLSMAMHKRLSRRRRRSLGRWIHANAAGPVRPDRDESASERTAAASRDAVRADADRCARMWATAQARGSPRWSELRAQSRRAASSGPGRKASVSVSTQGRGGGASGQIHTVPNAGFGAVACETTSVTPGRQSREIRRLGNKGSPHGVLVPDRGA